jgi:glycine oxidase
VTGSLTPRADVVIVGGGIVGLSLAWRLASDGVTVAVCDPAPGRGSSWAAAGMLAPVTEVHYGEEDLLRLNLAAAERWPAFADALVEASGLDIGHRRDGTIAVALDADDRRVLDDITRFQHTLGLHATPCSSSELRALEPGLSPRVRGGSFVSGDHQVDPRRVVHALDVACRRSGVALVRHAVARVLVARGRARAVELDDGSRIDAGTIVLAAGCWARTIAGIPDDALPPVRPVKGQILRLRMPGDRPVLTRTVRGTAKGRSVYLVPRADGELVVGATVEEQGFDTSVVVGAVLDLLRAATDLVPDVAELVLEECHAGLRPGSPDNAPVLGPSGLDGLVLAAGHFRNGVLLAPLGADAVAAVVHDGALPDVAAPFTLQRFRRAATGATR